MPSRSPVHTLQRYLGLSREPSKRLTVREAALGAAVGAVTVAICKALRPGWWSFWLAVAAIATTNAVVLARRIRR